MERSPITEEVQIKTTMSQNLMLVRTATVNKTKKKTTHLGKDMEKLGQECDEDCKMVNRHLREVQYAFFSAIQFLGVF